MPASTYIKNFTDGNLVLKDGTGTPISKAITLQNGDVSVSGLKQGTQTIVRYQGRGAHRTSRFGEFEPVTITITAQMASFTGGSSTADPLDALRKAGAFSGAVSTHGANAQVMAYTLEFTVEGSNFGDAADHVLTALKVELEQVDFSEGDPNSFTLNMVCCGGMSWT